MQYLFRANTWAGVVRRFKAGIFHDRPSSFHTRIPTNAWLRALAIVWPLLGGHTGVYAQSNQDLVVVRSMPTATGATASKITYEIAYKNGGPGSANGANLTEQLPPGFQVLNASCAGAFGGATCPSLSVSNNTLPYSNPVITGSIGAFPEFSVVRVRVEMQLSANPGAYELSGSVAGPSLDPIVSTNNVLSSLYVRPLLLDLRTSYSSTHPALGGSNGSAGAQPTAIFDSDAIGSQLPMSVSYRVENLGPDTAPAGSFGWTPGGDFVDVANVNWTQAKYGSPLSTALQYPGDPQTYWTEVRVTPFQCQALGSAVCQAAMMYLVTDINTRYSRWLDHEPAVSPIGAAPGNPGFSWQVVSTDMPSESANDINPFSGKDIAPGAGLILTATVRDASYGYFARYDWTGDGSVSYVKTDNLLVPTSQLSSDSCKPDAGVMSIAAAIYYADPMTGVPYASISDGDLSNNEVSVNISGARNCPSADIAVTARAYSSNASPELVQDGDNYTMEYTLTNNGASAVPSVKILLSNWDSTMMPTFQSILPQSLNWSGFSESISCVSVTGSPCPSQSVLDAWVQNARASSKPDMLINAAMGAGSQWKIVFTGNAGTTACDGTHYHNYNWDGNLLAHGTTIEDSNPLNNYETATYGHSLSFRPQICPGATPRFQVIANKTPANNVVNVGDVQYYNIKVTNNASFGVGVENVAFYDGLNNAHWAINGSYDWQKYAYIDRAMPGFIRQTNGAQGMPIVDNSTSSVISSGIVCTASPGAICPVELNGNLNGGGYDNFGTVIPYLPSGGYVEFSVPWVARDASQGCAAAPYNQIYEINQANVQSNENTTVILPDSTRLNVQQNNVYGYFNAGVAGTYINIQPCPTGTPASVLQKTVRNKGTATPDGAATMNYSAAVSSGEVLTYDLSINNTGTLEATSLRLSDVADVVCRDGLVSNPSNISGQDRCGALKVSTLGCTAVGVAVCPAQSILNAAFSANQNYFEVVLSRSDFKLPPGGTLQFTSTYVVSGINSFAGVVKNGAQAFPVYFDQEPAPIDAATAIHLPFAPGMALAKSVDKLQAGEGETVTYTIDITNGGNGPLPAGAEFVDPLPANITAFTSATCVGMPGPAALPANGAGNCPLTITNDANGVRALLPQMLPNTALRFTITAIAPVGGVVTSVGNEAKLNVPTASSVATVLASANFAIPSAKETAQAAGMQGFKSVRNATAGGASVLPSEQLIYTISYANTGGMDIANFQVSDVLPAQVTYSGGASVGVTGPISAGQINPTYDGVGNTSLLEPGAVLGGGSSIVITLPVTVKAGVASGTVIYNQAMGSGSGVTGRINTDNVDNTNPACPTANPEPCLPTGVTVAIGSVPQQQTASQLSPTLVGVGTPAVVQNGQLTISKSVDQTSVAPGGNLTYTLMVGNTGNLAATGVALDDPLPAGMRFVSASDGGTWSGNTVHWTLDIPAGTHRSVTVTATVADNAVNDQVLINSAGLKNPAGFAPVSVMGPCTADVSRSCATSVVKASAPVATPAPVPTLANVALMLLSALMAGIAAMGLRRQHLMP